MAAGASVGRPAYVHTYAIHTSDVRNIIRAARIWRLWLSYRRNAEPMSQPFAARRKSTSLYVAVSIRNNCRILSECHLKPRPHQQQCPSNDCQMLQVERFFRQCRMLLQHCCRFRKQCRTKFRPFDKAETNWTCSIWFDFVERTKFYDGIVGHCCRWWQQSRMLLRQCCWFERGLSIVI